uniref:Uncharacterized protein n=1 Tax=Setaria digitata TaxID=48799 RepID=A0A915PM70_9BILA
MMVAECQTSLRRKRFTRRQRRYLAGGIFGERTSSRSTSALNKVLRSGSTTSSSDSGNAREQRKRSTQLTTPRRKSQSSRRVRGTTPTPASAEAAFLSLRRSYVNSSLVTRSTTEICSESTSIRPLASIELPDSFQKFKGPAARKAHRRTLRYKLNSVANNQYETKTGSQIGLNVHAANAQFNEDTLVRRSVSFRELNGRMIDFTNQDSVTRWTSQILAEIDSLPSSSFDLTGQSTLQLPAIINTTAFGTSDTITDKDLVNFKEREDDSTMGGTQNQLHSPSSNISFEIGEMNSTASASTPSNNVSEPGSLLSVDHKTQKTASKSSSIRFMKFQKRNSCRKNKKKGTDWARKGYKVENRQLESYRWEMVIRGLCLIADVDKWKDIWHQSMDVSEVSCTSNIVLTARPSHRSKQSAHAVVISLPKDPKISEKLHSLSPKSALSSYSPNLESHIHPKIESNSNESSRLWRFLSRKKYSSFKKYLKFQQKSVPLITVAPDTKVSGSNEATLLALINDKNHPSEYNSGPKCRINKVESDYSLPVSKTNLSFESQRRFSQMPNPDYQQFNYAVTKEMERKRNLIGTGGNGSSRSCFSMESIDVMNEEKLKFVDEKRQIEPVDQTASPLTVWKRRRETVEAKQAIGKKEG